MQTELINKITNKKKDWALFQYAILFMRKYIKKYEFKQYLVKTQGYEYEDAAEKNISTHCG